MSYGPLLSPRCRAVLMLGLLAACSSGASLPHDTGVAARFPIALLPSAQGDAVVVAGANFDRAFRAGSLRVIDTKTDRWVPQAATEIPSFAAGLAWLPGAKSEGLVVSARENDALTLVDVKTTPSWQFECAVDVETGACSEGHTLGNPDSDVSVGNDPMAVLFEPTPAKAALTTAPWLAHVIATTDGRVSLFGYDPGKSGKAAWTPLDAITLNAGLQQMRRSSLTGRVYVSDARFAALHVYHTEAGVGPDQPPVRIVLEPAVSLPASSPADYGRGLALSHDEAMLYVSWRSPNAIAMVDVSPKADGSPRNLLLDLVPLGASPSDVALAPTGPGGRELVYVACYGADAIWVVDPLLRTVVAKVALPHAPYGLTSVQVPGLGWKLYAGVFAQHKVAVIPLSPGPQQHQLAGFVEAP